MEVRHNRAALIYRFLYEKLLGSKLNQRAAANGREGWKLAERTELRNDLVVPSADKPTLMWWTPWTPSTRTAQSSLGRAL